MGDTTQAVQLVFDKVESLAHHYGPLALQSVQVDAISQITSGVVSLIAGTAAAIVCARGVKWAKREDFCDDELLVALWCGPSGLVAIILGWIAATNLCDLWNWTALFNPALWLAHIAVLKLGS